jgi:cell division protein FtsX
MIRHALAEGWLLLKNRWIVSVALAAALAIPISLAGVTWSVMRWLEPVVGLAGQATVVPVLLHPHMDSSQRSQWLADQRERHPEWQIDEVSPERLAERLTRWFPYLGDLLEEGGNAMLSPLVEIATSDPATIDDIVDSPAVIAIGPRSSIYSSLGRTARALGWVLGAFSALLLLAATLFAAVWVHLELYRHSDEVTIMRLVGAAESAIRGPFIVASIAPGAMGAALSVGVTLLTVAWLSRLVGVLALPPVSVPAPVLVLEVVLACGLPLAAALFTLARHAATDFEGA